jgi:hypothetical protein
VVEQVVLEARTTDYQCWLAMLENENDDPVLTTRKMMLEMSSWMMTMRSTQGMLVLRPIQNQMARVCMAECRYWGSVGL